MKRQAGLSIPIAIFVLLIVGMLGAAMVKILNQGQESIAREIISIRALMAAESGAEGGLNRLLVVGAACGGDLSNPPTSFVSLYSWTFNAPSLAGCTASVSCGQVQVDSDGDGADEDFFTVRSVGSCGPTGSRATRIVEVQAR